MSMRMKNLLHCVLAACALALIQSPSASGASFGGTVRSAKEGLMEGVLVSAKKAGSTITTTVVSDAKGAFRFPPGRLEAGRYTLRIRAIGYDLQGPQELTVPAAGEAKAALTLVPTKNLVAQLSNAEWLASAPGPEDFKKTMYNCDQCHNLDLVFHSKHTAKDFTDGGVLQRMVQYSAGAFPLLPQKRPTTRDMGRSFGEGVDKFAAYLASINLSAQKTWPFAFQTFERPKGRGTKVIITEYDMPNRIIQPHDVITDPEGMAWYTDFGQNRIGKLDPKTGKVTEFPYEATRPPGWPNGILGIEVDRDGKFWISRQAQTGVARFDRKTEKFEHFPIPEAMRDDSTRQGQVAPGYWHVDGKVWFSDSDNQNVGRLNVESGTFDPWFKPFAHLPAGVRHSTYGLHPDEGNNLYFMSFSNSHIGRIDAKTLAVTLYATPTPKSRPRRGRMDSQGRLWFAEWGADKVGMFDPKTLEMKEWAMPTKYASPYDAQMDKNGEVWTSGQNDDRVSRLNPKTGEVVQYLYPRDVNVRRVHVDNSTVRPTFWTGGAHTASIIRVEPLD